MPTIGVFQQNPPNVSNAAPARILAANGYFELTAGRHSVTCELPVRAECCDGLTKRSGANAEFKSD